eukprot:TRINITY_DN3511_c2_g1_i6.p3 TRINITY_DN3511_c2_g1~~TRINITY_DN3511_c2_g1_i6.p3  ORF type:complete len:133 (-),score=7.11 TRINITY_DN3511_c2_g1_i6:125-523(-)
MTYLSVPEHALPPDTQQWSICSCTTMDTHWTLPNHRHRWPAESDLELDSESDSEKDLGSDSELDLESDWESDSLDSLLAPADSEKDLGSDSELDLESDWGSDSVLDSLLAPACRSACRAWIHNSLDWLARLC